MSPRRISVAVATGGAAVIASLGTIGGAAAQGRVGGTEPSRVAGATQERVAAARQGAPVQVAQTDAGPLLVDRAGYTIFMFTRDKRGKDRCARISGCLTDWPAVTTTGTPVAGPGVKRSLLGTIPYRGKLRELTYAGYPLHTYKFDYGKRSTMNIGNSQFGGSWYGLTATGKLVK